METIMSETELKRGLEVYNKKDYKEAFAIFQPVAEQGNALAQAYLGAMYDNGNGVPQNYGEAAKWYRKAAIQGEANAQLNLGMMYIQGHGVPQYNDYAYMWLSLAKTNGVEEAQEVIKILTKDMSSEEIDAAQNLAKNCWDSNYQDCPE